MNNKEMLQEHNNIIEENNLTIDDIVESIKSLPNATPEPILQEKNIVPTTSEQIIEPDNDYDGFSKVIVSGVTSSIDSDIKSNNIRKGINILGVTGTMEEYVEPKLQNKSATPTTSNQTITPDSSYDGLSSVSIEAVTSSIDSNIKAENIRSGVSILGIDGSLEEITPEDLTNEFNDYENNLIEQETTIEDITTALQGKGTGGGITPSGVLDITENGTYDVTNYASANVNVESSEEISEYTRIDYIQFSGNQWVDTGIIGNQDTQICTAFTWESSTQRHLCGCASSDNLASITSYMNGSWRFGNKVATKSIGSKNPKIPYSVLMNKTTIGISNSVTTISDVNDFETVGTLLIGGARDSDGTQPSVGITGKIFYFYIWQGETQVLKLFPAVNKDGVYGFLDDISGKFLTSITNTPLGGGNL